MNGLNEKVVLIFAASRGIGRATALKLAAEKAIVAVGYASNKEAADEVVGTIEEEGGKAYAFKADVSQRDQVIAAFDDAIRLYGKVDIVINAGATSVFSPLEMITVDDFEKAIAVNVRGAFNVLQEASSRTADGGRIIQFSTGGTKMPVAGGSVYAGTKSAGENFALGLSKELGSRQITVNVISPGVTDTDGLVMPKEQVQMLIAQTPLGRLGQPEDIADVVTFLVSHEGRWVTGQNIQANGGIL